MGLESTTTIQGLDTTFPTSGDPRSQGDDHLRLIKIVLKTMFPGSTGLGMTVPITAKEADLNSIFTTGVKSVFYQAAAPTGWTIANPGTNFVLVSAATGGATGGGAGRSDNLVTGCTVLPDHVHAQQGTFGSSVSNQSLNHTHTQAGNASFGNINVQAAGGNIVMLFGAGAQITGAADLTGHNHNVTISGFTTGNQSGNIGNWQPQYATTIICSKN